MGFFLLITILFIIYFNNIYIYLCLIVNLNDKNTLSHLNHSSKSCTNATSASLYCLSLLLLSFMIDRPQFWILTCGLVAYEKTMSILSASIRKWHAVDRVRCCRKIRWFFYCCHYIRRTNEICGPRFPTKIWKKENVNLLEKKQFCDSYQNQWILIIHELKKA